MSNAENDLIGAVVAGRYRVLDVLGRGGMGVVYRVEHVRTGEQLALKVLTGAARFDPQALARFKREARASAKIDSPHVVRVVDADDAAELGGAPFLVMELLRGEDLERWVVEHGPLAPADLVPVLLQVGCGVERAHRVGVVHRDLKPENLFLHEGPDGRRVAKVLDFGISRFVSEAALAVSASATVTGSLVGTPLFMSPEQAAGEHAKIGPATDIWALGLVTLRLLTGEHYWGRGSIAEVVTKIMVGAMPPPSQRWPDAPAMSPALDAWFARSCDREPAARFASVEEQMEALATALGIDATKEWSGTDLPAASGRWSSPLALAPTEPGAALTDTPLAAVASVRPPRASRRLATVAVAATVAILGGVAVSAKTFRRAPAAPPPAPLPPSTLTASSGTLACPIFESSGTKTAGWFGAAAAEYACRVGIDMLGGRPERVRVPAELLGLPRTPTTDFPVEPFEQPDARARSLEAAKHADAYLDGHIERRDHSFTLTLESHRPTGERVAQVRSEGPDFHNLVADAMAKLATAGGIPRASKLDPEVAYWQTYDSVDAAIWLRRYITIIGRYPAEERCMGYQKLLESFGHWRPMAEATCANLPARLDDSSVPALLASVIGDPETLPADQARGALERLRKEPTRATSSYARISLAIGEATILHQSLGDSAGAEALLREALGQSPGDSLLWQTTLDVSQYGQDNVLTAVRAWLPSWAIGWDYARHSASLDLVRRSFDLHPTSFLSSALLSGEMARRGERDELRAFIAHAGAWTDDIHARWASGYAVARLELLEARFGHGRQRCETLLTEEKLDDLEIEFALDAWLDTNTATGLQGAEERRVADQLIERFEPRARADRSELAFGDVFVELALSATPERALPVLARLRPVITRPELRAYLDGVVLKLKGDERGAVNAWRPLVAPFGLSGRIPSRSFAAVGDYETALRLNQQGGRGDDRFYGGHDPKAPLTARYLYLKGDKARAKELAQRLLTDWSAADIEVPALVDMRRIVAEQPLR